MGAWLLLCALFVVWASLATRAALAHVDDASGTLTPEGLVVGSGLDPLREARADFDLAERLTGSWVLAPVRSVPFLGRQVRGTRSLTGDARDVLDVGVDAAERAQRKIEGVRAGGEARVRAMRDLSVLAADARGQIARTSLGSPRGLLAPIARAHRHFEDRLPELERALGDLEDAASGLGDFLEGPRVYLVLAANNNEMRMGSGAFLSAGWLYVQDGEMSLSGFRPTANARLGPDRAVPMEPDQADLWGYLAPNDEWRNLGASARFDTTASLVDAMSAELLGFHVDGVLALDPVALTDLVDATGPVSAAGRAKLEGSELLQYLLLDQYYGASTYDSLQRARRDALGTIAGQVVDRVDEGTWEADSLVHALRKAAAGRHVLAWSRHESEQRTWAIAGIDGALDPESFMVGVHNRGGNKLDVFLPVRGSITTRASKEGTVVGVTVRLDNTAFVGLPRYVAGPYPGARGASYEVYQGFVAFYLPEGATDIHLKGNRLVVAEGTDGGHPVVAVQVKLPRGTRDEVSVEFLVPEGRHMRVESSARAPAIVWEHNDVTWSDALNSVRLF